MPGPVPKTAATRQRRNRTSTSVRLEASPATKIALPALAPNDAGPAAWHPRTVAWWDTIWDSPMAEEWVDADVPGLLMLARLVDAFWASGDARVHAELRMASREFGLSPLSRRSLQWEIQRVELVKRGRAASTERRRRSGPTVLSILSRRTA